MKIWCLETVYGVQEMGIQTVSDFLIPYVILYNDADEPVEPQALTFSVFGPEGCLTRTRLDGKTIESRFQAAAGEWKLYRPATWERTLGLRRSFPVEELCTEGPILPGQRAVVHQEFFRVHSGQPVRSVEIRLDWPDGSVARSCGVTLNPQKNRYRFPIRKPCWATGAYLDPDAHRWCRNSEFAVDVGLPASGGQLDPAAILGEPVYAAADGVVLRCFGSVGADETDPELLENRYGNDVRIDGNFIILEHAERECSLYAHLLRLGRDWKAGDFVRQGELLGYVGSSGNSSCPHLHFHVFIREGMFGPSIPVIFDGLTDLYGDPLNRVIRDDMFVLPTSGPL